MMSHTHKCVSRKHITIATVLVRKDNNGEVVEIVTWFQIVA